MGNNPTLRDRVRFTLQHQDMDAIIIDEPIGWDDDEKEYARHEDYHGIFPKFSNSLKFVGNGSEYISFVYQAFGIQTNLRLVKEERHPKTDRWTRSYEGYLDMSTYEEEAGQVSVKFNSGGLEEMLKAREGEDVEIDRLESMDGVPMTPLVPRTVALDGRRIFLKSKWELNPTNTDDMDISVTSEVGATRAESEGFPFEKLVYRSHEQAYAVIFNAEADDDAGTTGMMFLANMDRERSFRIRAVGIRFRPVITRGAFPTSENPFQEYQWAYLKLSLTIYKDGTDFNVKERRTFFHGGENSVSIPNFKNIHNNLYEVNFDEIVTLEQGESVAVEVLLEADLSPGSSRVTVKLRDRGGVLYVDEDSGFPATQSKCLLPFEVGDRLLEIITNRKGLLKSKILGRTDIGYPQDGAAALTGLTHGFWVRNFDALPVGDEYNPNLFKPLTTSFKSFLTSYGAAWNVGLGIERTGFQERIVLEDLSYFYRRTVTIVLPSPVRKLKRSVATKYYYSGVEIGYNRGGEYSEAMGLDEYNGITKWNTMITKVKNVFSRLSEYRADSYGREFARRKQRSLDPTLDTAYDTDIFLMDLKRTPSGVFAERKWQDDFDDEPEGTYSPETATNLRLTPLQMLYRHGWEIVAGLIKYPTDYIRYGSSTANSKLTTRKSGILYAESGNIMNSELPKARYSAELVDFEHEVDFNIKQQIEGHTDINGERVYNVYGLIEFRNLDGKVERGWLQNLKPNGAGKWQLLIFNRN